MSGRYPIIQFTRVVLTDKLDSSEIVYGKPRLMLKSFGSHRRS